MSDKSTMPCQYDRALEITKIATMIYTEFAKDIGPKEREEIIGLIASFTVDVERIVNTVNQRITTHSE